MDNAVDGLSEEKLKDFFTSTQSFINHVYCVQQDFDLNPPKKHYGVSINYVDLKEYRQQFVEELVNTICDWVYSQRKAKSIIDKLIKQEKRSTQNANSKLQSLAREKFRRSKNDDLILQGQFGELLLFNFLQYFFGAVPLLRKMPITTSVGHERFGVDAIHYKKENNKNIFFLGESKAYTYGEQCQFYTAFEESLSSIITTYKNIDDEMGLYI